MNTLSRFLIHSLIGPGALACYLAGGVAAYGQQQIVVSIVTPQTDGGTRLTLHNYGSSAITAYAYATTFMAGTHRAGQDAIRDSKVLLGVSPIPPNGEFTTTVAGPKHIGLQCDFKAALFADGSSYGDPLWIARIENRRQYLMTALDAASSELTGLAGKGISAAEMIAKLAASKASQVNQMVSGDVDALSAIGETYGHAIHELEILYPDKSVIVRLQDIQTVVSHLQREKAKIGN